MSRTRVAMVATIAGAATVLGLGLAIPAVAAGRGPGGAAGAAGPVAGCTGSQTRSGSEDARGRMGSGGMGSGHMGSGGTAAGRMGSGRMGSGGRGAGDGSRTAYPSGELTAEQKDGLVTMVQEETLALDLYTAFADRYDDPVFDRVAASETRHVDAVRTLLATYGLEDPTVGAAPGDLADPALAAMYDDLLARGETSATEAYAVGRAVEVDDLARLAEAGAGVTAADVSHVYAQLTRASERHLAAFGGDA